MGTFNLSPYLCPLSSCMHKNCIAANHLANPDQVDQDVERAVSREEGEKWAKSHKLTYWETSAATGVGVFSMFHSLLQDVVEKMRSPQVDLYNSDGEMEK